MQWHPIIIDLRVKREMREEGNICINGVSHTGMPERHLGSCLRLSVVRSDLSLTSSVGTGILDSKIGLIK